MDELNKNYYNPNEVVDNREYMQKRIDAAVENALTREMGIEKPSWWRDEKNKTFLNCIGTATSNFGDKNTETGNQTFLNNYKEKGFRLLEDGEMPQPGDLVQIFSRKTNTPNHMLMLTSFDDKGNELFSYGDGGKVTKDSDGNIIYISSYKKNKPWRSDDDCEYEKRYRYVGTPDELALIEEHNKAIRERNSQLNNEPIKAEKTPIDTKKIETARFLHRIAERVNSKKL